MKNYLLLALLLLGGFFFHTHKALALDFVNVRSTTGAGTDHQTATTSTAFLQPLGHQISGKLKSWTVTVSYTDRSSGSASFDDNLLECTDDTYTTCTNAGGASFGAFTSFAFSPVVIDDGLIGVFNFNPLKYYAIEIQFDQGTGDGNFNLYLSDDEVVEGDGTTCLASTDSFATSNPCTAGDHNQNLKLTVTIYAFGNVEFVNPPFFDQFASFDFGQWAVCVTIPTVAGGDLYNIKFHYGSFDPDTQIADFTTYTDTSGDYFVPFGMDHENYLSCTTVPKGNSLSAGLYEVYADLIVDGSIINETAPLQFHIVTGTATSGTPEPINTANNSNQDKCAGQDNVIVRGFCKALVYLFIPPDGSFTTLSGLFTTVANKPPFGYFTAIHSALDFSGGTGDNPIPTPTGGLATYIFTPAKTLLSVAIYLLLGFWIFHRLRTFNFQH